jgi:hypothetical protein
LAVHTPQEANLHEGKLSAIIGLLFSVLLGMKQSDNPFSALSWYFVFSHGALLLSQFFLGKHMSAGRYKI